VLNGRKSQIGKVVVLVRGSVSGQSTLTNRSTRCIYAIRQEETCREVDKVARTALEELLGGFLWAFKMPASARNFTGGRKKGGVRRRNSFAMVRR
jgi:hypothetical protein